MDKRLIDLYAVPNIENYEDVHLMTLREHCLELESKLEDVKLRMNTDDRLLLDSYIDMRDELEFQSIKMALRWGKQHIH